MSEPVSAAPEPKIPELICPHCGIKPFIFVTTPSLIKETGQLFQMFACKACNVMLNVQWTGMYEPMMPQPNRIIA